MNTKAAEAKAHEAIARPRQVKPLANSRLKVLRSSESDFGNQFGAVLETGTPLADMLDPAFWSLHANKMRVGDIVEIHIDDLSLFARVLVREVSGVSANKNRAVVAMLEKHEFSRLQPSEDVTTHQVQHLGPHRRWCVLRLSDQRAVSEGHETREIAEAAMRSLARQVA
jgi:hypothetical protein